MSGKVYGIGIGPGDPELLTLKAVRILNEADVVVVPWGMNNNRSLALRIIGDYLKPGVEVVNQVFPMVRDEKEKQAARKDNANVIRKMTEAGKVVAFVTLGDVTLYSTFIYVMDYLKEWLVSVEVVPGITSYSAIAARYNRALVMQNEKLQIIPMSKNTDPESATCQSDTVVFMKVSSNNEVLADYLKKHDNVFEYMIASACGTPDEKIDMTVDDLYNDVPYMTTVIARKKKM